MTICAQGTEEKPIIIRGAPGETVTITRPDAKKGVIDIDDSRYLVLESFQNYGGSNAIRKYSADQVMMYELRISKSAGAAVTVNSEDTSCLSAVDC